MKVEFDYIEKETTRLGYFGNVYLIVGTLLLQLPYVFGWIELDNLNVLISLNTITFIFSGFMFSIIGSGRITNKLYDKEQEVIDSILLLKVNGKAGKAFQFISNQFSDKLNKNEYNNIRHYISKCYFKTTAEYWDAVLGDEFHAKIKIKELIGMTLQSIFASIVGEVYMQLDVGWYEIFVFSITMILGGIYGYKSGKNLALIHDLYPLRTLQLLLEKFMNDNKITKREITSEDRLAVKYYNLEKDAVITY